MPADPNETDRAIRYAATQPGNFLVAMGRSKLLPVATEDGKPLFAGDYKFEYGKATWIREGKDACIIAMGMMMPRALKAREILKDRGHLGRHPQHVVADRAGQRSRCARPRRRSSSRHTRTTASAPASAR